MSEKLSNVETNSLIRPTVFRDVQAIEWGGLDEESPQVIIAFSCAVSRVKELYQAKINYVDADDYVNQTQIRRAKCVAIFFNDLSLLNNYDEQHPSNEEQFIDAYVLAENYVNNLPRIAERSDLVEVSLKNPIMKAIDMLSRISSLGLDVDTISKSDKDFAAQIKGDELINIRRGAARLIEQYYQN